ncbi:MAG: F0F1 ATP synthase subunit B [Bacteroidota bacterium]
MELLTPSIGLVFWMIVGFAILFLLLKKMAWKPILNMLKEREDSIQNALDSARKAKEEMLALQAGNEKILQEARLERDKILKEARDMKDSIIAEARTRAQKEGERLLTIARETIHNEKMAAITELKNQVAQLSLEIAERILKEELSSQEKQKKLVKALLDDVNLN